MQESSDYQVAAPLALRHEPVQAYERREMPEVEPVLRSLARQCPSFRKFPLLRILKDIARLFLLTQTEALFLQYVVRETEWGTGEAWIRVYAGRVKDLLCFLYEEQEYQ